jgi:hypothetical protein
MGMSPAARYRAMAAVAGSPPVAPDATPDLPLRTDAREAGGVAL